MEFKDLINALEAAGYEPRSYSGRCMYGRKCLGVTTDDSSVKVVSAAIEEMCAESYEEPEALLETVRDWLSELSEVSQDSMGLSSIIYWPKIKWQETDEPKEESEEG